ncbi:MAG: hypothetical protein GX088_01635 [Clostridia bacterium]|nr:hypothetical protein [Clostridia bacterium]
MSRVLRSVEVDEVYHLDLNLEPAENDEEDLLGESQSLEQLSKESLAAEREREEILSRARKEAEELIKKAQEEASQIIEMAREQEKEIFKEAEERGYGEGYRKGFEKAMEEAREEADRIRSKAFKVLKEAEDRRKELIISAEGEVVDLCLAIASKVVHAHAEEHRETVVRMVRDALERLASAKHYSIIVNPKDAELLHQYIDELSRHASANAHIHILEDESVGIGGCKVETEMGLLDATLESQLDEIRKFLSEEVIKRQQEYEQD